MGWEIVDWIHLAHDRDQLYNFSVPKTDGEFLD
jgi:hypothetical protein